jgi:predicted transposase/invertase (TIGR01784 family)
MKRLNPLNDFAFKMAMGEPGCEEQLKSVLNAVLASTRKIPIESLEIVENKTLTPDILGAKTSILDIRAKFGNGTKVNVEVQLKNEYNMDRRSLFYWAWEYTKGFEAGHDYRELRDVITVNILGYSLFPLSEFHTSFHLREDKHPELIVTSATELHFLEMPKFRRLRDKDIEHDPLHRWLQYFDAKTPDRVVKELITMDPVLERAQKVMDEIQRDEGLLHAYHMYEMSLSDETSRLNYALEKGLRQGMKKGVKQGKEQGLKQGMEQGQKKEKLGIAQKMKLAGLSKKQIAAFTGLSPKEIQ